MVDIDLSRNEDSVTSLAVAQSSNSSAVAFAGINSSEADQKTGKNEHLRCFRLHYPPRRRSTTENQELGDEADITSGGSTEALSRVSLFTPSTAAKKETYQRVLRLLRPSENESGGIGAVATGLASEGEVVLFGYTRQHAEPDAGLGRIKLAKGEEAADIDLIQVKSGDYRLAYCTDYEVFLTKVAVPKQESLKAQFLYGTPFPDAFAPSKARPKFRSLRFLTPNLLLLLQNRPDRKGADLLLLDIPKFSSLGSIVLRKYLHKSIKSATALSVALLPASSTSQNAQHAIAVAGQDNSITILTVDHPSLPPFPSMSFSTYSFHASVHPLQITSLAFSTFKIPREPSKAPPQYLKLASTSVASTVVVHALPLSPFSPSQKPSTSQHYVLRSSRSEAAQITISVLISALAIALGAFFLQAFTEIRGGTPEYLGAKDWLSSRVHGYIARPYMFEDLAITASPLASLSSQIDTTKTMVEKTTEKLGLRHLLSKRQGSTELSAIDESGTDIIVVSPHEDGKSISTESRNPAQMLEGNVQAKKWEDLHEADREGWKRRLIEAGEWAAEEGESVLQGVFFSELAGVVREVVGGMVG